MNDSFANPEQSGIVFDIQRCSMYDGPGIRTTIFLKGCPLRCIWCHNPESQSLNPQLAYYREKCTGCQSCGRIHPQVHLFEPCLLPDKHQILYQNCSVCGNCVNSCPSSALKIFGEAADAQTLMDLVLKDRAFYEETDGGLTISGGEPFLQHSFLLALLKAAKGANISTCVETSGLVSREHLEEAMPYIDIFLFDYKESSSERHKEFTGVDNSLILDNLDFLYRCEKDIVLRCPIIPGYNDTSEHFMGIAGMEKLYPKLSGIEILPYHDLGKTKALAIGNEYEVSADTADTDVKIKWKEMLGTCGCSARIMNSF